MPDQKVIVMILDIKAVQNRLLYMGKGITSILDRNGIPYTITYGTLIGAVRHQGFIPWDDDFDIMLFDENYDDAIACLRKELPEDLFLEDASSEPKFFHAWPRVRDLKTCSVRQQFMHDGGYAHQGLTVDMYRIRKVKINEILELTRSEYKAYLDRRKRNNLLNEADYTRHMAAIERMDEIFEERVAKNETPESMNREVYSNIYHSTFWVLHEIEDFFPLKRFKFEDIELLGPNNPDKILTLYYGDYMTPPPEMARNAHFSEVEYLE